ncbi:hypothetical protein CC1G_13422 [Coprinopsis cinerea okayama7|uniref:Uncharacterized protein n=1 Tax=Coprinopsis cinerea (strain Okayama-7 / 130 / ATCC MYA-4618 / FGSC 9003) TaxID=240176 RepID=A8NPL9_COPC7|nr:hypothetical protein CC1G_13422 [Coprinopsis cinerea okayama7\|eukprot:XP_001835362.1 hypothetical protein CC1G_13422 [Coprinopsis cinerea okayama7\
MSSTPLRASSEPPTSILKRKTASTPPFVLKPIIQRTGPQSSVSDSMSATSDQGPSFDHRPAPPSSPPPQYLPPDSIQAALHEWPHSSHQNYTHNQQVALELYSRSNQNNETFRQWFQNLLDQSHSSLASFYDDLLSTAAARYETHRESLQSQLNSLEASYNVFKASVETQRRESYHLHSRQLAKTKESFRSMRDSIRLHAVRHLASPSDFENFLYDLNMPRPPRSARLPPGRGRPRPSG